MSMVAVQVRRADDDEPSVGRAQHLDRNAVQRGERLGRDHVFGLSFDRGPAGEVHDAVEVADDRVDVVRDEQHGDVLLLADTADERGDADLVRQVEAVERLVEQQEPRPADERLRDQQSLLLAAGQLADRSARVVRRADELDRVRDALRRRAAARAGKRDPPARAVEPEADEVDPANARALVEAPPLRQVADVLVRLAGAFSEHGCGPRAERLLAEDRVDEASTCRRRSGRAPRRSRPRSTVMETSLQIVVPPMTRLGVAEVDRRLTRRERERRSAFELPRLATAGSVADAGVSVSVIVVTGMPFLRAASVMPLRRRACCSGC